MEVKLGQTSAALGISLWRKLYIESGCFDVFDRCQRRRIAKVVRGVNAAGAALGAGVKTNALCEMDLLGEDDGNEYRFDAMS